MALVIFAVFPLSNMLKNSSQNLVRQRDTLNLFQEQLSSLEDFQRKHSLYQEYLARIENSFVDPGSPINFMEFLETQAARANLQIQKSPSLPSFTADDPWLSTGLEILLGGSFENCLRFLERLQHSPWLIEISQLEIERVSEGSIQSRAFKGLSPDDVYFTLSLKVFSGEVAAEEEK